MESHLDGSHTYLRRDSRLFKFNNDKSLLDYNRRNNSSALLEGFFNSGKQSDIQRPFEAIQLVKKKEEKEEKEQNEEKEEEEERSR